MPPRAQAPARPAGALLLTALLALPAESLSAQGAWPDADLRAGTLAFDAKATLGDFTGTTTAVRGRMTGGATLAEVRGWVEAPVASFRTGNGRRDRDLNKSMESAIFPTIRFELDSVRAGWERGDSAGVTLAGRFTIHGITRAEQVPAVVHRGAAGVHLAATLPMDVRDYQVKGLSKFLGALKMDPAIVVRIDLTFGGAPPPG